MTSEQPIYRGAGDEINNCVKVFENFRKFKVALNPMYRNFLNFAKSCVLLCLSKVDNNKKFHRAVFEL